MVDSLRGVSGGRKQQWLRSHRPEVLSFFHANGPEATKERFCLTQTTLEAFLSRPELDYTRLTNATRALVIAQNAMETARDNTRRVNELEEQLCQLLPVVRVMCAFSEILRMVARLPLPDAMPSDAATVDEDLLRVPSLRGKSSKRS